MLTLLGMMAGAAAAPRVSLTGDSLFDDTVTPTDAEVGYQLSATGLEQSYEGVGSGYVTIDTWLLSGSAADYDGRLTATGEQPTGGSALATWLNLGTTRAWTLTDSSSIGGALTNSCLVEIRDATTLITLVSATVTMHAHETA